MRSVAWKLITFCGTLKQRGLLNPAKSAYDWRSLNGQLFNSQHLFNRLVKITDNRCGHSAYCYCYCCQNHHQYSFCKPTDGWTDSVGLIDWLSRWFAYLKMVTILTKPGVEYLCWLKPTCCCQPMLPPTRATILMLTWVHQSIFILYQMAVE